jgi:hypothetical protein
MRLFICLLALTVAASSPAQPPDWAEPQMIGIDMANFAFVPSTLTVRKGIPYRLHLVTVRVTAIILWPRIFSPKLAFIPAIKQRCATMQSRSAGTAA